MQTRNVDLFTGSGLENHTVLTIEKRLGKIPFANCGWAGMLGAISGLTAGLAAPAQPAPARAMPGDGPPATALPQPSVNTAPPPVRNP